MASAFLFLGGPRGDRSIPTFPRESVPFQSVGWQNRMSIRLLGVQGQAACCGKDSCGERPSSAAAGALRNTA